MQFFHQLLLSASPLAFIETVEEAQKTRLCHSAVPRRLWQLSVICRGKTCLQNPQKTCRVSHVARHVASCRTSRRGDMSHVSQIFKTFSRHVLFSQRATGDHHKNLWYPYLIISCYNTIHPAPSSTNQALFCLSHGVKLPPAFLPTLTCNRNFEVEMTQT